MKNFEAFGAYTGGFVSFEWITQQMNSCTQHINDVVLFPVYNIWIANEIFFVIIGHSEKGISKQLAKNSKWKKDIKYYRSITLKKFLLAKTKLLWLKNLMTSAMAIIFRTKGINLYVGDLLNKSIVSDGSTW